MARGAYGTTVQGLHGTLLLGVQPDNRRAGGVTEWMEIAAIADAYGLEDSRFTETLQKLPDVFMMKH